MMRSDELVYIRKLNAQELGYRMGTPRQAGRYIFVSKECLIYFPPLGTFVRNDYVVIYIIPPHQNLSPVMCKYVYHNDKIVDNNPGGRDECRIYLNSEIDPGSSHLQPEDIIILLRFVDNETGEMVYRIFRFPVADRGSDYERLEVLLASGQVRGSHALVPVSQISFLHIVEEVEPTEPIIPPEVTNDVFQDPLMNEYEEVEVTSITRLARSSSFRDMVLQFYDYKCALGGPVIRYSKWINLIGAHIIPRHKRGGNNPVNGISLCQDFHWAFDKGFFTIEDNYNVLIHSEAVDISVLSSKNGMRLILPEDERARPHRDALRYHREQIFGRFIG